MARQKESRGWAYELSMRAVKAVNVLAMTAAFSVIWYLVYSRHLHCPPTGMRFWAVLGLFAVLYGGFGRIYDGFMLSISRLSEMVLSQMLSVVITEGIIYMVFWLAAGAPPQILPMLLCFPVQLVVAIIWCLCSNRWYYATYCPRRCVIVHEDRNDLRVMLQQYHLERKFNIQASVSVEACLENMPQLFENKDAVFLWGVCSHKRNIILKYCVEHGIRCYLVPRVGDMLISGGKVVHMFHLPLISVGRFRAAPGYYVVKRLSDIVLCTAALVLLSPVMLATAAAIKLTDHGPVFYKQTRLTKERREFELIKFRSMCVDAEKDGQARLSTGEADPRVTRVGRLIRAVRIDELPQLFNIIRGDMSLVGPRPERPEIAQMYEKTLPEFSLRLQVPAGLTGYAQVYGKYNTPPYDKLQMDLLYISHAGLWEDFRIMLATVKVVFTRESTEGVEEGQMTAVK